MIDVLYRVRKGNANEPLRYSLRSLSNIPHGDVYVVGSPPAWANVNVITPQRFRTKWRGLVADLALACAELKGRRLLLIDDDMFILTPRDNVPVMHNGDLRTAAERKVGGYAKTMTYTADYLEERGLPTLSYELHIPLEIDADAMTEALTPVLNSRRPIQARSVYGNTHGIGGTETQDVKVATGPTPPAFLSTSPQSWRYWLPQLASMFRDPSVYEHA